MGNMKLPRAILFDLDDTILVAFGPAQSQWQRTIAAFADRLGPIEATVIAAAIEAASTELWADPARHKFWRHRTGAARQNLRSEEHTSELQSLAYLVCRLLLEKKKEKQETHKKTKKTDKETRKK